MKIFKILLVVAMVISPSLCFSDPVEEHIKKSYVKLVSEVFKHKYGPAAAIDLAKFAILRQMVEDGLGRSPNISIVGMSVGGRNERVIKLVLECNGQDINLGKVANPEGGQFYALYGNDAYIVSAVGIAVLYDRIINECNFKDGERIVWERCKYDSTDYLINSKICFSLIKRANNMYGPKGDYIYRQVIKYERLFTELLK